VKSANSGELLWSISVPACITTFDLIDRGLGFL
jgi:hypothetical protein